MADPFIAEIRMFGFNFAPTGWAACDGQILPIQQNTALFSLLGTTYGGDGKTVFALPNLMAGLPIGAGQGPGLSPRELGQPGGQATVTLTPAQLPVHQHVLRGTASPNSKSPADAALASTANGTPLYRRPGATTPMAGGAQALAGQSAPHENRPPSLVLMFCIALQGVFPPRS